MSNLITKRVWAKLWNDKRSYDVQLSLEVRPLPGQRAIPDDYAVANVTLLGGIAVMDDTYNLEYQFNGRQEKSTVRVVDGMLLNAVAA